MTKAQEYKLKAQKALEQKIIKEQKKIDGKVRKLLQDAEDEAEKGEMQYTVEGDEFRAILQMQHVRDLITSESYGFILSGGSEAVTISWDVALDETVTEPETTPMPEPVTEPVSEPVTEPETPPTTVSLPEPSPEPEPDTQPAGEPDPKLVTEPVTDSRNPFKRR